MNSPFFIFFFQPGAVVSVTGVAQIQEAPDTVVGIAAPPLTGVGGVTEAPDVLAGAGVIAPALPPGFVQEAPDTLAATGKVDVKGEAVIPELPDVVVVPLCSRDSLQVTTPRAGEGSGAGYDPTPSSGIRMTRISSRWLRGSLLVTRLPCLCGLRTRGTSPGV